MKKVTLFYRDASNFKFRATFEVNEQSPEIQALLDEYGADELEDLTSEPGEDPTITYTDLGITLPEFHVAIGQPYNDTLDHDFVTIESVSPV